MNYYLVNNNDDLVKIIMKKWKNKYIFLYKINIFIIRKT